MYAIIMDRPKVRGTKRKWNMVAAANCSLDRKTGSIKSSRLEVD